MKAVLKALAVLLFVFVFMPQADAATAMDSCPDVPDCTWDTGCSETYGHQCLTGINGQKACSGWCWTTYCFAIGTMWECGGMGNYLCQCVEWP